MKKMRCSVSDHTTASIIKYLLMMKMTILLMCVFSLQSFANKGFGQDNITLKLDNTSLRKAFREIEKQTIFHFVYSEELLPANQKVSIDVEGEPLDAVMKKLLDKTSLTFKVISNDLVVISTEPNKENADQSPPPTVIKGRVVNANNQPISNASVIEKGTNNGTVTNEDGNFTLNVLNANATLIISYVGFETQEVKIGGRSNITIRLEEFNKEMNEVVVVGYGTQKRSDITGSVASVPKSRLTQIPVTNVLHAIEGSVAGLTVTQNSSIPGSSASVLIRGQNSINANSSPYIVVDGIPLSSTGGSTNDINPNDIASIEVLKDASATAIYGVKGSAGVILITTKRGISGKPVIRYNGYVGLEDIPHILKPRNGEQYVTKWADYWREAYPNITQPSVVPNYSELANYNAGKTTDWIKEMTQQGVVTDNNLSISGGTKDVKYYLSGEYLKEKGVVDGYQYHRASFRSNIDVNVTSYLTVGTSLFIAANNYDGGRVNLLNGTAMSPYGVEYDALGNYNIYPMYPELLYTNPLIGLYVDRTDRSKNLNGNFYAELNLGGILPGLKFRVNASDSYVPTDAGSYTGRNANSTTGGNANIFNSETNNRIIENILSYNKDWKKHHVDFTGLYSAQQTDYFASSINANGFVNDFLSYYNFSAATTLSPGNITLSPGTISGTASGSYKYQTNLLSQMGRINYSYDNRYLFTLTARRDGSSVFGAATTKYGVFPSAAFGWNVSKESFMNSINFVNNLKLRLSYGKTGNPAIGVNQTATVDATVLYPFEGQSTVGVLASTLGNANLHWETTKGFNAGLDFSILKSRIDGSVDVYHSRTTGLLLKRNLPNITGYTSIYDNIGITDNKGIEISLNTKNITGRNFRWESMIVFSSNKNKIVDLYGDKKSDVGNRWFIGQPVSVIYDYKMTGIWQTGEDPSKQDPLARPGDLKFADINGDGKITQDKDKVILGQTAPKWIGSLTNTFHYKDFHLNIFIQTAQGMLKNNADLSYADESGRRNTPIDVGYWTPENKSNTRPSLAYSSSKGYKGYGYPSDASYTRIKDVTLSYTFPQKTLDKAKLGSLTLYVSGRNLYTFTNWIGWDPEDDYSMRGGGTWTNNYPVVRTVVFGANISLR